MHPLAPSSGFRFASLLALTAMLGAAPPAAMAVTRTCGANALANTANVLCAAPSGPCTATAVTMSTNIEVTTAGCEFDLGGRTLSIQKTFQMTGNAFLKFRNAGAITVTPTGKLKARGDFVEPAGYIIQGGWISLASSGPIAIGGSIDVSGDPAGLIEITADGNVTLQSGSLLQGNGTTSFVFDAQRFADGGSIEVTSTAGGVTASGDITATGTQWGAGGDVSLQAARDVNVTRQIDASGGGSDGGEIDLFAGDNVAVTAAMTVESRGGGGFGGVMVIAAGADDLGGIVSGGGVTVDGVALQLGGSSFGGFGGDGGVLDVSTLGPIRFQGAGVAIRANAGTQYDGYGGTIFFDSTDNAPNTVGPLDGDITVNGLITADSSGSGGYGGGIVFNAGRQLTINASIDVSGKEGGGEVFATSGAATAVNGALNATATSATGKPGNIELHAGAAQDASLTVAANVLANGGVSSTTGESIRLSACTLVVAPGVKIDGHAGTGTTAGSVLSLISRHPMQLGSNSQYLATPSGEIETIHPAGQNPVIGSGVVFNPPRADFVIADGPYEACPAATGVPTPIATP